MLLEDFLNTNRTHLLAHPERELKDGDISQLDHLIARRARHEPLAYIRRKTEFYGRSFYIDHRVLEPRPESEAMISLLKSLIPGLRKDGPCAVVDVGTGSGALAITAKLELPDLEIYATDIDPGCLKIARKNGQNLSADINLIHTDLFSSLFPMLPATCYLLLCNLPYVPDNFHVNPAAMQEPRRAIFGGQDGLDLYRVLFRQIDYRKQKPRLIFTESLPPQHEKLAEIALSAGFKLLQEEDFIQVFSLLS